MLDPTGVRALGKVDDERKRYELERADVLCAPSIGGESFGMVLTEAFAAGTPVVASNIAGYRDVVKDGVDGVLIPAGDAQTLAETLRDLHHEPQRRQQLAAAAAVNARAFAWEGVAAQVLDAYENAIATPALQHARAEAAVRLGLRSADLKPRAPARRLPSLEQTTELERRQGIWAHARRAGMLGITLAGVILATLALRKIGIASITHALISSSPTFVLLGLATMCAAMAARGVAWFEILKAALPRARLRLSDAMQGTMIGVLMSSTLPGTPRRTGESAGRRPEDRSPAGEPACRARIARSPRRCSTSSLWRSSGRSCSRRSTSSRAMNRICSSPRSCRCSLLVFIIAAPVVLRFTPIDGRFARAHAVLAQVRGGLAKVREGLSVFRQPRRGAIAAAAQLSAWALQCLSCDLLLLALGLGSQTGIAAAAGVLFAVNITAVLPAMLANLGVFQAACAAVLHAGWHVGLGTGVAYGVILQAVEVTTAFLMGTPALLKEGMSWREVKMRAIHASPVRLSAREDDESEFSTALSTRAS